MKLLIFSDSHGNVANMADVVRLESPDRILHLGDMARDAEDLATAGGPTCRRSGSLRWTDAGS